MPASPAVAADPPPPDLRIERTRRFLVDPAGWAGTPVRVLDDRYLRAGRLRLRRQSDLDAERVIYKLTRKLGPDGAREQGIVTIRLDREEWEAMRALPANPLVKRRGYEAHEGRIFSVDVYEGRLAGVVTCELEAGPGEDLDAVAFPPFCTREVTGDPRYSGGYLARTGTAG